MEKEEERKSSQNEKEFNCLQDNKLCTILRVKGQQEELFKKQFYGTVTHYNVKVVVFGRD